MFERLMHKCRRFLAALLAVVVTVTGIQVPAFADTAYSDYLDGWKVQAAWNTLSTDYEWNAKTDETRQPKVVITYRMDHAEKDYPAGSLTFAVPGIGNANRGNVVKADKIAADGEDSEWNYTWDQESDTYVFTNKFAVKAGQSVSGGFELLWTLDSREVENGFKQTASPTFAVADAGSIVLEPLSFAYASEKDVYTIASRWGRLSGEEYDEADKDYVWYDFETRFDVDWKARGPYKSNFRIDLEIPDGTSLDNVKVLYQGKEQEIKENEDGSYGFYVFREKYGDIAGRYNSKWEYFQIGFKKATAAKDSMEAYDNGVLPAEVASDETATLSTPERRSLAGAKASEASFEGQSVSIRKNLEILYDDETEWTIVDLGDQADTVLTVEDYRFDHSGYAYAHDFWNKDHENYGKAPNYYNYNSNDDARHEEPPVYTDRLNAVNLYNGKVVEFSMRGRAKRQYSSASKRRAAVGRTAFAATPSEADEAVEEMEVLAEDWNDIHWHENTEAYSLDEEHEGTGITYGDLHPEGELSTGSAAGRSVWEDLKEDGELFVPDIDIFGDLADAVSGVKNTFGMKAYAASVQTASEPEREEEGVMLADNAGTGIGAEDAYSLILGEDKFAVYLKNGGIRNLEDEEYDISYVTVNGTTEKRQYEIYGARSQDTAFEDYELIGTGDTGSTRTTQIAPGYKAVFVRVNDVVGTYEYFANVGVRFHLNWDEVQSEAEGDRPDHENRLIGFSFMRVLCANSQGAEFNDDAIESEEGYGGSYGQELAERDKELYGEMLHRDYSNVWLRSPVTSVNVSTVLSAFEGGGQDGFVSSVLSSGTVKADNEGELSRFSLYTVIPEGITVDLDNTEIRIEGSGEYLDGTKVADFADYVSVSAGEHDGKTMMVADFDFSGNPLQASVSTQVRMEFDVALSYADYIAYGNRYGMESYLLVNDDGLDKVSGRAVKADLHDIDGDGNTTEVLAFSSDYETVLDDATEWREYVSKYAKTAYSGGYVEDTVTRLYVDSDSEENKEKSFYSYRLDFGLGSNNAKNIVFFDRIEQGAEVSVQGENGEMTKDVPSAWQGKFLSVDTTQAEKMGLVPTVYYSVNPKQELDLNASGWTTTLPDDTGKVKAVAVSLSTENMDKGLMQTKQMAYVLVNMQAPAARNLIGKQAVNQYTVQYDAYGLTSGFERTYTLTSSETYVKLLDNVGKIVLQKVDADNVTGTNPDGTEKHASLTGAKFQIYDPDGKALFEEGGRELNSLGRIVVNNVRQGTYSWEEVEAPLAYERIEGRHAFVVDGTNEAVTIENLRIPGQATLVVQDRDNPAYGPLSGAEFELFRSDGTKVFTDSDNAFSETGNKAVFETGADGTLTVTGLPWGSYYFVETSAPDGYEISATRITFSVGKEQYDEKTDTVAVELETSNREKTADILLKKTDSEDGRPVRNATFSLYREADGEDELVTRGLKTNAVGELLVEELRFGTYYFVETRNAGGYLMPDDAHAKTESVTLDVSTVEQTLEVSMENDRMEGSVVLTKKDDAGQLVGGATYGLWHKATGADDFVKVGSYTTDDNRQSETYGELKAENLKWGDYYFLEEKAPMGYELSKEQAKFTIDRESVQNTVYLDVVDNRLTGSVKFVKADKADHEKKLAGAVYELYRTDGTKCVAGTDYTLPAGMTEIKTGADGSIILSGIKQGSYYFKETVAPTGYSLSDELVRFSVTKENAAVVQEILAEDEAGKAVITVNKKVNDVYEAFGNPTFVFKVTRDDGKVYKKSVTLSKESQEGTVSFNVEQGHTYRIEEEGISRYLTGKVTAGANAKVEGTSVVADLTVAASADATFENAMEQYEKFSHVSNSTNIVEASAKLTGISVEYTGPNPVTQDLPGYDADEEIYTIPKDDLVVTVFYDDGSSVVLKSGEYELNPDRITAGTNSYTGIVTYTENGAKRSAAFQVGVKLPQPKPRHTVTFDLGGGMIDPDGSGSLVDRLEMLVKEGKPAERPSNDPVRTGYLFLGWTTRAGINTESDAKRYAYDFNKVITGNSTVYAAWMENAVTLVSGQTFNNTIKTLAGSLDKIKSIRETDYVAENVVTQKISDNTSAVEAFAYFDETSGTIYIVTDAEKIYLNRSSGRMFLDCVSLTNLDALGNWDTSNVTSMWSMFYGCSSLTDIEVIADWDVSSVASMYYMFRDCAALTELEPLADWDVSSVTTMYYMFGSCTGITDLDGLKNWDMSSLKDIGSMFYGCAALTKLDSLTDWDVSSVTNMNAMFGSCTGITDLDGLKDWDVSSVTSMSSVFERCRSLTTLDALAGWDVSSVANMSYLFNGCAGLTELDALAEWDVSSVRDMSYMFASNSGLTSVDPLANWDVSNVTDMRTMFQNLNKLTETKALANWDVSSVIYMNSMFNGCAALTNLDALANWDVSSVRNMYSMFNNCAALTELDSLERWNVSSATDMGYMFHNCVGITDLGGLNGWDVSSVTNMRCMFNGCAAFTNLAALSKWDVSSVTNMESMFNLCDSLMELDGLANWDVSSVTNMSGMFKSNFKGRGSLINIDGLANWDVSSVTNMSSMFENCSHLTNLDALAKWNTGNVTRMNGMFWYCNALENLNGLTNWDVSKVTNMYIMFEYCHLLTDLDALSDWDVSSVTDMGNMFYGCYALTDLDALAGWDVGSVTTMSNMFRSCNKLADIKGLANWDVSSLTSMYSMFYGCIKLIDASSINDWDILKVTDFKEAFKACPSHPEFTKRPGTWDSNGTFTPNS